MIVINQITTKLEYPRSIALLEAILKIYPDLMSRFRKNYTCRDLFKDEVQNPRNQHVIVSDPRVEQIEIITFRFHDGAIDEANLVFN